MARFEEEIDFTGIDFGSIGDDVNFEDDYELVEDHEALPVSFRECFDDVDVLF